MSIVVIVEPFTAVSMRVYFAGLNPTGRVPMVAKALVAAVDTMPQSLWW